jgi:hypothetical protein
VIGAIVLIVTPGRARAGARVGVDAVGVRARHDTRRRSHRNRACGNHVHHHRPCTDRRPLANGGHDKRPGAEPAVGSDRDPRQRPVLEVYHSGTVANVLARAAQHLRGRGNVGAIANIDQAKHAVGADVDVPADRGLRVSEKGAKLDTPVEWTRGERELVVRYAKKVANHSGHEREGLREKFEPEAHPTKSCKQRGRHCEAQEYRLYAAFGNHFHANGRPRPRLGCAG